MCHVGRVIDRSELFGRQLYACSYALGARTKRQDPWLIFAKGHDLRDWIHILII